MADSKTTVEKAPKSKMYKNRVALSDETKQKVVDLMEVPLAASLDMYSQAKFAHWNVKGMNFYQLHLVFDATAKVIFKQIDPIAERITQIGGVANGLVRQSAKYSQIPPYNTEAIDGPSHLKSLADSLGAYCKILRETGDAVEEAGDGPSSDFFNQLIVDAEEELYFLESHLEAGDVQ